MVNYESLKQASYEYLNMVNDLKEVYLSAVEHYNMGLIHMTELDAQIQGTHYKRIKAMGEIAQKYDLDNADMEYVKAAARMLDEHS